MNKTMSPIPPVRTLHWTSGRRAHFALLNTAIVLPLFGLAGTARAQTYVASFLALPSGATTGVATSIADGQIGGYSGSTVLNERPLLWSVSDPSSVTALSAGGAQVWGVSGGKQVGGSVSLSAAPRALNWTGTTASRQNFLDATVQSDVFFRSNSSSTAYGISGTKAVGYIYGVDQNGAVHNHAMFWNGLSSIPIDLHPTSASDSQAFGVSANQQVGFAGFASSGHAYLWKGSAASGIDLNPTGFTSSVARATTDVYQVGSATNNSGASQAALWTGTAASFLNLNPTGYAASALNGAAGNFQVGWASLTARGATNAFLWTGSAASTVNLQQFLPAGTTSSVAYGIDSQGNIVGVADGKPVLWRRVSTTEAPEPSPLLYLAMIGGCSRGLRLLQRCGKYKRSRS